MKSTYDKVAAEAFAGDPTPRDEMEPWKRISILIQSGMNYAMAAESILKELRSKEVTS